MIVPGNQVMRLSWKANSSQGIVHSYSVRGLVDGRDDDTIGMVYLGKLRWWQIKTEVLQLDGVLWSLYIWE